jgi:hypothetical protein
LREKKGFRGESLDDGVRGQLVEHGMAAARAAIELDALRSVLTGTKGKRGSWAAGY